MNKEQTKKQFFNDLYIMIAGTDLLITITCFPVTCSLFRGRDKVLFQSSIFCSIWGTIWEILPYVSVFLVALLSISRMIIVIKPLRVLQQKWLKISALVYVCSLVILKTVPVIMEYVGHHRAGVPKPDYDKIGTFHYNRHSVYCFIMARAPETATAIVEHSHIWKMNAVSCSLFMAFPIIPIILSCTVSIVKILQASALSRRVKRNNRVQKSATVTVVIVTIVYITYNIPVFLNYLIYAITSFSPEISYRDVYSNVFIYWYSWVLTYVILVAMNSSTNPIVYYLRMQGYKKYISVGINYFTEVIPNGTPTSNNTPHDMDSLDDRRFFSVINRISSTVGKDNSIVATNKLASVNEDYKQYNSVV